MPELPEVETIKKYLERKIVKQKIQDIKIFDRKGFKGEKNKVIGTKILKIKRKGKFLIFILNNSYNLLFHLKMTGQILFFNFLRNSEINKATKVIFVLNNGYLIFNDVRRFGWVKVVAEKNLKEEIKNLGIDALNLTFDDLKEILSKTKRPIKLVLMDQRRIVGIGNIYANEALFLAKINPLKPANSLKNEEIKELLEAIKIVLKKAINYGGSSISSYVKPDKRKGKYQEKFLVYRREGEKCKNCKTVIEKIKLGGRSTFYCKNCQK